MQGPSGLAGVGRLAESKGREGYPARAQLAWLHAMPLVMFQLVRAGPSTPKHLSWVGGPLSVCLCEPPSLAVPAVAAPCNYACLPVQGATWARGDPPSIQVPGQGRWGTSAPAAAQLGLKVSTTKAVKGKDRGRPRTPVPALHRRRRSSGPDRRDKLQCQQTNIPDRQVTLAATMNHCQPLGSP